MYFWIPGGIRNGDPAVEHVHIPASFVDVFTKGSSKVGDEKNLKIVGLEFVRKLHFNASYFELQDGKSHSLPHARMTTQGAAYLKPYGNLANGTTKEDDETPLDDKTPRMVYA